MAKTPVRIAPTASRERRIFQRTRLPGEDRVRVTEILRLLDACGLRRDDPRLRAPIAELDAYPRDATLEEAELLELTRGGLLVLEAAAAGRLIIPQFGAFATDVREVLREAERNRDGRVADYIPQLGRVDPDLFGLAVCTIDGQRLTEGDAFTPFCIQSVSKPLNYCSALEELGERPSTATWAASRAA